MLLTGAEWKNPRSDANRTHDNAPGAEGLGGTAADKNLKPFSCTARTLQTHSKRK